LGVVLEDQQKANDKEEMIGGIKVVYEKQLAFYVESASLDHRKDIFGREGFFIDTAAGGSC